MVDYNPKEQTPRAVVIMGLFEELGESFYHEGLEGVYRWKFEMAHFTCSQSLRITVRRNEVILCIEQEQALDSICRGISFYAWLPPRTKIYDEAYSDQLDAYIEALSSAVADSAVAEDQARKDATALRVYEETRF